MGPLFKCPSVWGTVLYNSGNLMSMKDELKAEKMII